MSASSRPNRWDRPESKQEPELLFNVTVSFRDGEADVFIAEVGESEVVGMSKHLGDPEARMRFTPTPGTHYFTAANRIKHITATLIETKESN